MSRPPRPHPETATHGELVARDRRLAVQPHGFESLIELQHELAADELAMIPPGGDGDFAETLFELSALVAHVLGKYQDHYGSEAFLGTALTTRSLLAHGRRLAYAPDPGLSASGVVSFTIRSGLDGELPEGLALSSAPKGEHKAQKFATTEARVVEAAWNAIEPAAATQNATYAAATSVITIVGIEHGLAVGELIVLASTASFADAMLFTVLVIDEDDDAQTTSLTLDASLPTTITDASTWSIHARPRARAPLFGWDADPVVFPTDEIRDEGLWSGLTPSYGYTLDAASGLALATTDVFLARRSDDPLDDELALIYADGGYSLARFKADSQRDVDVVFHSKVSVTVTTTVNGDVYESIDTVHRWFAASSTRVELELPSGDLVERSNVAPNASLLHDFELVVPLLASVPNPQPLATGDVLELDDTYAFEPGMRVVFQDRAGSKAELIEIVRVETAVSGNTELEWKRVATSSESWTLGELLVLGNIVAVAHGEAVHEILGDSDGSAPFQRFMLRKPRVSQLASVAGAEPELEVRVADVLWERVVDFGDSGSSDRHYRVELDENHQLHVLFGDGRQGAVPSKGRRHIVADYRVGLGEDGNLDAGRLTRLAQAHPLIEAVTNPLAIVGGSEPADAEVVIREATRRIRTFDRAVSARDHADLALLYPGVARTNVAFDAQVGIQLVVSDAKGESLADPTDLLGFLDARRDTSVPLTLLAPEPVALKLRLAVEIDPAFVTQRVETDLRSALLGSSEDAPGLFTFAARELGQAAHFSEVHALLAGIAGVVFVEITTFEYLLVGPPPLPATVHDVLVVEPHQWISLSSIDLQITSVSSEVA